MTEGAEVPISPLSLSPHDHRSGPFVSLGDGQKWVGLVVTKTNVEAGLVPLDEAVLQHESIHFGRNFDPFN
jgi:hypothetical protein|tara:strand:- start:83 stop:295 length:213 start_codon:yes stop_codon:yes gene_type:complete